MLLVLAAGLVIVHFTPLKQGLRQVHEFSDWLKGLGYVAPAAFVAVASALIAVGCPRLLFCPIGGMAFGFLPGLLWAQLAALIGCYGTFIFARWSGREFVLRKWPGLCRHSQWIAQRGCLSVVLARQIPVASIWVNALLALSHVKHRDFLAGTAIGTLPEAIPATLLGAGVAQLSVAKGIALVLVAVIWLVLVWQGLKWLRRPSKPDATVLGTAGPEEKG